MASLASPVTMSRSVSSKSGSRSTESSSAITASAASTSIRRELRFASVDDARVLGEAVPGVAFRRPESESGSKFAAICSKPTCESTSTED